MAIRQYIGARYVIKVYENSQDPSSAEWEADVTYEPLTMVTYLNSSYLSKKDVPGSVGNPANNPSYWVVTGAYNGQIAALQNQIDTINNTDLPAIQNEIDTINNTTIPAVKDVVDDIAYTKLNGRRVVVITDSYGVVTTNFLECMQTMCPELVTNDNFFKFAYPSTGFVSDGTNTWQAKFVTSGDINTVTDPETITDIFVVGGSNDRGAGISISDIMTAGQTFYNSLVAVFTNARIFCGYIGYSVNAASGPYIPTVKQAYQDMGLYGYRPISHSESWLHYTGYISDNVHPTAAGSRRIAIGMLNTLLGGGSDDIFDNRPVAASLTAETGFTSSTMQNRLYTYHFGNRSHLKFNPPSFLFNSADLKFNGDWVKFATITGDTFLYGANDDYHIAFGIANYEYNGVNYSVPAQFKLYNKGLYIKLLPNEGAQGGTAITLTYVTICFGGWEADDVFI